MPQWLMKAAVQGVLSQLPNPQRWNRLFQKHVTHSLTLPDEYFLEKWRKCQQHLENYRRFSPAPNSERGIVAMELGTGWLPIVPIGLMLSGATKAISVDMQDLLAPEQVRDTIKRYVGFIKAGLVKPNNPGDLERLEQQLTRATSTPAREMLGALGVESVLGDARNLPLETGSVDLICSNNTLEHIPRDVIAGMLREFRRLLHADGVMSHHIDLGDHYAVFDSTINVYNFLKFSDRIWPLFNTSLHYVNRLRVPEFRDLHRETGWQILDEQNKREPVEELRKVSLAPQFTRFSEDDLLVYDTWLVSRPEAEH